MDLPKTDIPDVSAESKSTPPNTMLKGSTYNELKIISVTSKLSHWDLPIKCEQDNFVQEYTVEDHLFQEYSEEYNQENCNKTKRQYTNLDATYENVKVKNEIIEELDSSNNCAQVKENFKIKNEIIEEVDSGKDFVKEDIKVKNEIIEELDSFNNFLHTQEDIEVKNEIIEELDSFNNFVHTQEDIEVKNEVIEELDSFNNFVHTQEDIEVKNEIIEEIDSFNNFVHTQEDIEVKNEVIEELDSSNDFVQVKEVTSDLDKDREINDFLHIATEPKHNYVEEFSESETNETTNFSNVNGIMNGNTNRGLNHFENVDKVLKHFEKVDWISENNKKVDMGMSNVEIVEEMPTLKCKVCFKAFVGDDAYIEHMKKHTTKNIRPDEVKQFGAVLKVGDSLPDKCTLVKVKKIRVKRLATDKSNEDNMTKSKTGRLQGECAETSDRAENNGYIVQSDSDSSKKNKTVDININKGDVGDEISTVKDENNSSTAVEEENKGLLIEIPGKAKIIKLADKNAKIKRHLKLVYKKCDEDCTNDEHCTQSKECRVKRRRKSDIGANYACESCDYTCKYKNHLDAHMLTHTRVKGFKCKLCGYQCVQRCHLDQHMRRHSQNKPYSCEFCDYNCVQQSQLDQHLRTHTKARPYRCNICGYTCKQRCHLDQHMRRHTGIKPYSCIFCEYTCVQSAHLDQHIKNVHTNVHVFRCHACKYKCLQMDQLTKHMKVHNNHNVNPD